MRGARTDDEDTDVVERTFTTDRGDAGERLDRVLQRHLSGLDAATRTRVQAWINGGRVTVNGRLVRRVAARAMAGDDISIALPEVPSRTLPVAQQLPLDVLYEDEALLVVDKPAGIVVHPTYRHTEGTLLNALLWHARDWRADQRPSVVGRLDKLTSGLVLVAKTAAVHAKLQTTLASPASRKDYLAVVWGPVSPIEGIIDLRLRRDPADRRRVVASESEGANSRTEFLRLGQSAVPTATIALLRCRLLTGRMHQIRVHLAASGWPIVGDAKYGEPRWAQVDDTGTRAALAGFARQALHAWRFSFRHPLIGSPLEVEAPLPEDFATLVGLFGGLRT